MSRAALQSIMEAAFTVPVYAANAVDTPEEKRFVVIRWEDRTRAFGTHGPTTVSIWLHDKDPDYTWIDEMIKTIIADLPNHVHVQASDGILTMIEWQATSGDLWDDGYNTVTKFITCRAVMR